jgi:serine/threonine protein kinase
MEPNEPPRVFSERYELNHLIARGGMAEVYRAHDRLLDRPVALKVLFPELSVDRSFVERFRREAQAAANLSHPTSSRSSTGVRTQGPTSSSWSSSTAARCPPSSRRPDPCRPTGPPTSAPMWPPPSATPTSTA